MAQDENAPPPAADNAPDPATAGTDARRPRQRRQPKPSRPRGRPAKDSPAPDADAPLPAGTEAPAPAVDPTPPARDRRPDAGRPRVFVCIEETFWKNRLWRVGERTADPNAEGNCFREE